MSGALIQLMANESFENTYNLTRKATLFAVAFFATIVGVWLWKLKK
jgi:hypothetical protein